MSKDFYTLLDMINDFGIESFRYGIYETRRHLPDGYDAKWKSEMIYQKREKLREEITKRLHDVYFRTIGQKEKGNQSD